MPKFVSVLLRITMLFTTSAALPVTPATYAQPQSAPAAVEDGDTVPAAQQRSILASSSTCVRNGSYDAIKNSPIFALWRSYDHPLQGNPLGCPAWGTQTTPYVAFDRGNIYYNRDEGSAFAVFNTMADYYETHKVRLGALITSEIGNCYLGGSEVWTRNGFGLKCTRGIVSETTRYSPPLPAMKFPYQGALTYNGGPHRWGSRPWTVSAVGSGSGIDFGGAGGQVVAMASGTVIAGTLPGGLFTPDQEGLNCTDPGLGCWVAVRSDFSGVVLIYGHVIPNPALQVGSWLAQGTLIGKDRSSSKTIIGNSQGPHVHVELRNGVSRGTGFLRFGDPIDWSGIVIDGYMISAAIASDNREQQFDYQGTAVQLASSQGLPQGQRVDLRSHNIEGMKLYGSTSDGYPYQVLMSNQDYDLCKHVSQCEDFTGFGALQRTYFANVRNNLLNASRSSRTAPAANSQLISSNVARPYVPRPDRPDPDQPPPPISGNCSDTSRSGVYFYADKDYRGSCLYTTADVVDFGTSIGNNSLSSVRIVGQWSVRIYEDRNLGGRSDPLSRSDANLDIRSLGGQYSSARIRSTASTCPTDDTPGIYLYADTNYRGACAFTTTDIPHLGNTTVGNNRLSSIRFIGPYDAKIYEDADYRGRYDDIGRDQPNLDIRSLGGQYTSLKVKYSPPPMPTPLPDTFTLIEPVSFSPQTLIAGRPTTARVTLRHNGGTATTFRNIVLSVRGPGCLDWCNSQVWDWPHHTGVTLAPGEQRTFESRRVLEVPGLYNVRVLIEDDQGRWYEVNNSAQVFSVAEGIVLHTPLDLPTAALTAGSRVTATFALQNNADEPITLANVLAGGRGPDCSDGWACATVFDFPHIAGVTLQPGAVYQYEQAVTVTEPGAYLFRPVFQYSSDYWNVIEQQVDLYVNRGIVLSSDFQLDPPRPVSGMSVTATFQLTNEAPFHLTVPSVAVVARGPSCAVGDWSCSAVRDWPHSAPLTLAPGETYTYRTQQVFADHGTGYWGAAMWSDTNGHWHPFAAGQRSAFSVEPGLVLAEALTLTPAQPRAGELVTATFALRNDAAQPLTLERIYVGAQGPDCQDFTCLDADAQKWADFPIRGPLTLAPGETYRYQAARMLLQPGANYVVQPLSVDASGGWRLYGERETFTVAPGLELVDEVTLSPAQPMVGDRVLITFTLANTSDRAMSVPPIHAAAFLPACPSGDYYLSLEEFAVRSIPPGGRQTFLVEHLHDETGDVRILLTARMDTADGWWLNLPRDDGDEMLIGYQVLPRVWSLFLPYTER